MDLPAFTVHLASARLICANAAGLDLLGISGRDELAGLPLERLFPQFEGKPACARGAGWLRLPSGVRRYLGWTLAPLPDREGEGLLLFDPGGAAALETEALHRFHQIADGAAAGPGDALRLAAGAVRELLDLPLVRLLRLDEAGLCEEAASGGEDAAAAARLDGGEAVPAPSLRAGREVRPVQLRLDAAAGSAWHAALDRCGIHGILAWPVELGRQRYVLELHAEGADDLAGAECAALLGRWLPWLQERLRQQAAEVTQGLAGQALLEAASPAFITDTQGCIVWVNRAFTEVYGHSEAQALGATPRLIKSGVHGPRYYRALWAALRSGTPWSGETVDRGADGREVVVRQTISPLRHGGRITHFLSIHTDTTEQARMRELSELERGVDEICGLLTRSAFEERVRQALCTAEDSLKPVAWMLCAVSSRFGRAPQLDAAALVHVRGLIGQRLREVCGGAIVGELDTFEFAVLLRQTPEQSAGLAQAIVEVIGEPLPLLGDSLGLRCRVAFASFPEDGGCVQELRLAADRALAAAEPGPRPLPAGVG
jgi:PAS domain S-box-containing protein